MSEGQKASNRPIGKAQSLIERTLGSIRRCFSGGRCRYRGLDRTHTQNILEVMAYKTSNVRRGSSYASEHEIDEKSLDSQIELLEIWIRRGQNYRKSTRREPQPILSRSA